MRTLWSLTKRNILVYCKDKTAVFFSLLSALITIGLYAVFLAETNIRSVEELIPAGRSSIIFLVNSWVMAGIIVVNSVTVTLGALGIMIEDEAEKRLPAFLVSPVSRAKLTLSYILAAFIIGNILCLFTLALTEVYIAGTGGELLPPGQMVKVVGLIGLNVFSATCTVFFLVTFVRSQNAFATLSTIIGTLIGFLAGVYLPTGLLPTAVQTVMKCIPVFYSASLMRDSFMAQPLTLVFKNAPDCLVSNYLQIMGVTIDWGGNLVANPMKIAIIFGSGLLFLILSTLVMRKRKMLRL